MGEDTTAREATRRVVRAIVDAAGDNARRTKASGQVQGDALTDLYVRAAARAAAELPKDQAPEAFLLALGIALGDSPLLLENPVTGELWQSLESKAERTRRRQVLGDPTMQGRRDLARHFFASASLTALVGSVASEALGLAKEMSDADQETGFSFADLAADHAGIHFAQQLQQGSLDVGRLARDFRVSHYMPRIDGLREGLRQAEVERVDFAAVNGTYPRTLGAIHRRILQLPAYRRAEPQRGNGPLR
jgi:hypothetical protein